TGNRMFVGPLLFTRTVASAMEIEGAPTMVVTTAVLLPRYGSTPARDTETTFVRVVPARVGTPTIVTLALDAPGTVPRTQLTTPPVWEQLPCEGNAELN